MNFTHLTFLPWIALDPHFMDGDGKEKKALEDGEKEIMEKEG